MMLLKWTRQLYLMKIVSLFEDVVITYETATSDKLAAVLRMSVYEKMLSKMQQKNTDNNEN